MNVKEQITSKIMFCIIITSNVIIVMRQKFILLLSVVYSLSDEMEGQGDASEGGQISSQTEI